MSPRHINILFADDDDAFRSIMTTVLQEDSQYNLTSVSSGEETIELLKGNTFDVIILDYKMGHVSGLNVLQWMHEQKIETPVIMLTAAGSEEIAVEAMRLGAYDYVRKENIEIKHFHIVLDSAYERYLFRNERKEWEKIKLQREKNLVILDMHHETASAFGQFINNALTVFSIKMDEYEQDLLPYVTEEGKQNFTLAFNDLREELSILTSGYRSVVDLARMVTGRSALARESSNTTVSGSERPFMAKQQIDEKNKDTVESRAL